MVLGTVRQFPPTTYPLKDGSCNNQRNAWTTRLRARCVHVHQNISSKTLKIQRNVHVLYVEEIICRLHLSNHHLMSPLSIRRG
ncbi:unnamed protein product [Rhizophagus irregularis]|nr:unnamed protein product [Rhizophagus irregularis]